MIVDEGALCICDRAFNGVKLLRKIDALPAAFDHRNHRGEMTVRPLETLDYVGMGLVFQDAPLSPTGGSWQLELPNDYVRNGSKADTIAPGSTQNDPRKTEGAAAAIKAACETKP